MSKYLNNTEIEEQVSSVDGDQGKAKDAVGLAHRSCYNVVDCGEWKGNGAESIKSYINNGAINCLGGLMESIDMLVRVGNVLKSDWLGYESDSSGKVDQETVENLREDHQRDESDWESLLSSMESTMAGGEYHTSMTDLCGSSVESAFSKLFSDMDEILSDLHSTDSSAVADPEQLLADIRKVKEQIAGTMNHMYVGGGMPNTATMISRAESLRGQTFFSDLPNNAMWHYQSDNPYFPQKGINTTPFSEWNMGIVDGDLRVFQGYRDEIQKEIYDPLVYLEMKELGWSGRTKILGHEIKMSIGAKTEILREFPDGTRRYGNDATLFAHSINPTDPNKAGITFNKEVGGWHTHQFASADGKYTQSSFNFNVGKQNFQAKGDLGPVNIDLKASSKVGYLGGNYRAGETNLNENGLNFKGTEFSMDAGLLHADMSRSDSIGPVGAAATVDFDAFNGKGAFANYQEGNDHKFGLIAEVNKYRGRLQHGLQYQDHYVGMNSGALKNISPGLTEKFPGHLSNEDKFIDKGNKGIGGMVTWTDRYDDSGNFTGIDVTTDIKSDNIKWIQKKTGWNLDEEGKATGEKIYSSFHIPKFW